MNQHYFTKHLCSILLCTILCLSLSAQRNEDNSLKQLLRRNATQLGLSNQDIQDSKITNAYTDEKTGLQYIYLQQAFQDIRVFNQIKTILVKNGAVVYSSGSFIKDLPAKGNGKTRSVDAAKAVGRAAQHLNLKAPDLRMLEDRMITDKKMVFGPGGISRNNIEAELLWVPNEQGTEVSLCWNVNINQVNSPDWWNVRIDAGTGQFVSKDNWTVHEHKNDMADDHFVGNTTKKHRKEKGKSLLTVNSPFFASPTITNGNYNVFAYPIESPLHGGLSIEKDPWLKTGSNNDAATYGWHFDGTNNYNTTQGNNVHAYEDRDANNLPNNPPSPSSFATSSTGIPVLNFTATPNFSQDPSTPNNINAAITNLFYWNNISHNLLYQYGFTESTGNFQTDNLGRGGLGGDHVRAEAQDGSGMNNANFSTPPDGFRPRMQMFLWSGKLTFTVNAPGAIAGNYNAIESNFSPNNKLRNVGPITGQVVRYEDGGGTNLACVSPTNAADLVGKIALISRGSCTFTTKVKNAQIAGAIAVIVTNNTIGNIMMSGSDPTIEIPAIAISQADGATIGNQLANGVFVTMSATQDLDSDFDNGIIVHEYGHGVSNRLTGGANNVSCLSNLEQAGEGWSDYLGLMLTTDWATAQLTDGVKPRGIGNYAMGQTTSQPGIRRFPFSTDMSINPLTYANMPTSSIPHGIGEIWCAAIWDMTWNIIEQEGYINPDLFNPANNGGNAIALRLVMEGMKMQPCSPGFIQSRDAIIAADKLLYGGKHYCAIWKAFARRGMGASASQGLSTSVTDQTVAFDYPCIDITCPPTITVNAEQGKCNALVNLTTPATAVGNPAPTVTYSINGTNITFPYTFPVGTTTVTATATNSLTSNSCTFDVVVNDNQPASITNARANPATLWPADHRMRNVAVSYATSDNCGPVTTTLSVKSNEPINGLGDGDMAPDWEIVDNRNVRLRAERSGTGNGRIYTITITAKDANGNESTQDVTVTVPRDQSNRNSIAARNTLSEMSSVFDVQVTQNPSSTDFSVFVRSSNRTQNITMQVFDINGRMLMNRTVPAEQMIRFGSKFTPGTYVVKVIQGTETRQLKLVKTGN